MKPLRAPRRKVSMPAVARLAGNKSHSCKLVDVSETGVRIWLERATPLPAFLVMDMAPGKKILRGCRLVWQEGHEAGLEFLSVLSRGDPTLYIGEDVDVTWARPS